MKPKDYQQHGDPHSGMGYNYLYEIVGLDKYNAAFAGVRMTKDGYAKEFYSTGHNGLCSRVRTTLREFERVFCDGEFGALEAIVCWLTSARVLMRLALLRKKRFTNAINMATNG